jgi:hypothetical protein
MRKAMKVTPWPNGLGWDVGKNAEVWKLKNGLGVRIFTRDCKIKYLFIPDVMLPPVEAVERCRREGRIEE